MSDLLSSRFVLPYGAELSSRLCKAAMTEGLGDDQLRATGRHERLHRAW